MKLLFSCKIVEINTKKRYNKIESSDNMNKKNNNITNVKKNKKEITKKQTILSYILILLIDIAMIIYFARHNYVNYISLPGKEKVLISKTKNLFFGRNYITLIITFFFTIYTLLYNKYLLKIKNTKKLTISIIIFYIILNIALFYIFTKKIY